MASNPDDKIRDRLPGALATQRFAKGGMDRFIDTIEWIAAFFVGIGMQIANGCGSGTLYTMGGGSGRMIVTLAFFIIGSVIGSLHLPWFLALGGIDPVLAKDYFGAWGGLSVTLASLAAMAWIAIAVARWRGAAVTLPRNILIGAIVIGLLCIAVFIAGGHPWSVTFGFTLWGAKIASALGFNIATAEFWQWPGPKYALGNSVLSDTSSLVDFGMIFGATAAAAAKHKFARTAWPPLMSLLAAAVGGLLMGLSSIATIGATRPENLVLIVLDNGAYAATGGQRTASPHLDLAGMARACGFQTHDIRTAAGLAVAMLDAKVRPGPWLLRVAIGPKNQAAPYFLPDPVELAIDFRRYLQVPVERRANDESAST